MHLVIRCRVPTKITIDNASVFKSAKLIDLCAWYGILLSHSSHYYPQGNVLDESSNKNLLCIINRIVGDNKRSLYNKLKYALWADHITKKCATEKSPFELVYVLDVVFPINLILSVYKLLLHFATNLEALQAHVDAVV